MKLKAIIFTSETGYTRKYAEILAEKLNIPAYELKSVNPKSLKQEDSVIYLGWLMAGNIKGYKKAAKTFNVEAVCAVGMSASEVQSIEALKQQNQVIDKPLFYLQGGLNIDKLNGFNKFLMKIVKAAASKRLSEKPDRTEQESEMLEIFKKGGGRVDEKNLVEVLEWTANQI